jgi:hypothetical protein
MKLLPIEHMYVLCFIIQLDKKKILVKKELQVQKEVVLSGFAPKYPWAFRG